MKKAIASLLPEEIVRELGVSPSFRGNQIFHWLHDTINPSISFDFMTNLPNSLRRQLSEKAVLFTSELLESIKDPDGAVKFKIRLMDNQIIESVLLKDKAGRITVCLSTQVGCGMGCLFCRTGLLGINRNLYDYEIVEQFMLARSYSGNISNVVFMGMGEPLLNVSNLRKTITVLNHGEGDGISLRKITVSTCGIVEGIKELSVNGPHVKLAFSLVTADEDVRQKLMPINRTHPLGEIKKALLEYQAVTRKRITLEIVLIDEITNRQRDVDALLHFIESMKAIVNLIPYNQVKEFNYRTPDTDSIEEFKVRLSRAGILFTQRFSRGRNISGACGQLGVIRDRKYGNEKED